MINDFLDTFNFSSPSSLRGVHIKKLPLGGYYKLVILFSSLQQLYEKKRDISLLFGLKKISRKDFKRLFYAVWEKIEKVYAGVIKTAIIFDIKNEYYLSGPKLEKRFFKTLKRFTGKIIKETRKRRFLEYRAFSGKTNVLDIILVKLLYPKQHINTKIIDEIFEKNISSKNEKKDKQNSQKVGIKQSWETKNLIINLVTYLEINSCLTSREILETLTLEQALKKIEIIKEQKALDALIYGRPLANLANSALLKTKEGFKTRKEIENQLISLAFPEQKGTDTGADRLAKQLAGGANAC